MATLPPRNHNRLQSVLLTGTALRDQLIDEHGALVQRRDELLEMADAFEADHPVIGDDIASGMLADVITQLLKTAKAIDAKREAEKADYLAGGRMVDGFFTPLRDALDRRARQLNTKQTAYQRAKAERVRQEALAAAARARAEQEAAARIAEQRAMKNALAGAAVAQEVAEQAGAVAEAAEATAASSAAERSRTRGDFATASLRGTWRWEVADIDEIPREYLIPNEPLISVAIRQGKEVPGIKAWQEFTAVNRG